MKTPQDVTSRTTQAAEAGLGGASIELGSQELERLRAGLVILALRSLADREAAEEAAQETLTRAIEALKAGRLEKRENLGAFVRGIARNVIADELRARQRTTGLHNPAASAASSAQADPLSHIISKEERERVRLALAELSDSDQKILHLSFFEGLTPAEIAQTLNEPAERIRKRKSRALHRLRTAFSGKI